MPGVFLLRHDRNGSIIKVVHKIDAAQIAANILAVKTKINQAARRAGRNPEEITLVTVSKTFPAEAVEAAVAGGATDIGESRVQEATGKIDTLGPITCWHLIGHLQSNKAKKAAGYFDMIQSIDSLALAEKVSQGAVGLDKKIDCLIEMNSSGEESKFGFQPKDIMPAAEQIIALPGINLCGLMTIGPWTTDKGHIKKAFDFTRQTFQEMQSKLGERINVLSMGMSSDYELAIECGSTMVRVGTAVFGAR
jgi:pyridoxal phosphate enzyme (YggS family)